MPAATQYLTDSNSTAYKKLEEAYQNERQRRAKHADANWQAYESHFKPTLVDGIDDVEDQVILPISQTVIDGGLAAMLGSDDNGMIRGVRFEVEDENAQVFLDELWHVNKKGLFMLNLLKNMALSGHGFVHVLPEQVESDDPGFEGVLFPRLVALDPRTVSVFWDAMDAQTVLWYRVQVERYRRDIVREGRTWRIINYQDVSKSGYNAKWEVQDELIWNHNLPPLLDAQNLPVPAGRGYYGDDDLGIIPMLNQGINFLASNEARIHKLHAHPRTIVTGDSFGTNGPQTDKVGAIYEFMNENAKVFTLEMQSDLSALHKFREYLERIAYTAGREVNPNTVADKLGQLTNFGLRLLHSDRVFKIGVKWLLVGEMLRGVSQVGLMTMGFPKLKINVVPPSPLPSNQAEIAESLERAVNTFALSQDTALEQMGFDPEEEANKRLQNEIMQQETQLSQAGILQAEELRRMGANLRGADNEQQSDTE